MARLSKYASVSETRRVLERHGLATKHALGQNFLINDDILKKIVNLAGLDETDDVLEIGPGIGTLTVALLQHAHSVISIECDSDLPPVLTETTAPWANRFALIEQDALTVSSADIEKALARTRAGTDTLPQARANADVLPQTRANANAFAAMPAKDDCEQRHSAGEASACVEGERHGSRRSPSRNFPNKMVANLPYAVAATVVLDYFQRFSELESMTVMVQREVADRMMAQPSTKEYGSFTVKLSLYAQPAGRFPVGPGNFFPPPRVDSAVIRLDRRACIDDRGNCLTAEEIRDSCLMADAAFATRRKTLANSCKTFFQGRGEQGKRVVSKLPAMFERADIDARRRGETLSRQEFIALARAYASFEFGDDTTDEL